MCLENRRRAQRRESTITPQLSCVRDSFYIYRDNGIVIIAVQGQQGAFNYFYSASLVTADESDVLKDTMAAVTRLLTVVIKHGGTGVTAWLRFSPDVAQNDTGVGFGYLTNSPIEYNDWNNVSLFLSLCKYVYR